MCGFLYVISNLIEYSILELEHYCIGFKNYANSLLFKVVCNVAAITIFSATLSTVQFKILQANMFTTNRRNKKFLSFGIFNPQGNII